MARPKKIGLEYFPLDCQTDDKIEMLEAEHGLEGFAVYIKLLQSIYQTENGGLDMSVVFRWKTLARSYGIPVENLRKIIDTMLEIGLFDKVEFADSESLTSNGIQKRINKVSDLRGKDRERKTDDSISFPPGKLTENTGKSTQKEREREREREKENDLTTAASAATKKNRGRPAKQATEAFESFYALYPRKEAKSLAIKAFEKLEDAEQQKAIEFAAKWFENRNTSGPNGEDYRPLPASWLNQRRWTDEPAKPVQPRSNSYGPPPAPEKSSLNTSNQPKNIF